MHRYSLVILFCFTSFLCYSQTTKKVEGTVSIGCKVFNYTFTQSPSSIYSFYLEDIEKEGSLITFDKEMVSSLKISYEKYTAKLRATTAARNTRIDSLDSVTKRHIELAEVILNEESTLLYWQTHRDSIKKIIEESRLLALDAALKDSVDNTTFSKYLDTLGKITTQVADALKSKTYVINDFNQEAFVKLAKILINRYRILFLPECGEQKETDIANALFFDIKARLGFADDEPITAKIKLKSYRVNVYTGENLLLTKMNVRNVTVEFEDGTIKNLLADLDFDDNSSTTGINLPSRFKNIYPISVSGRSDPDNFGKAKLVVEDPSEFYSSITGPELDSALFKIIHYKTYGNSFVPLAVDTAQYMKEVEDLQKNLLKKGQVYIKLSELLSYYIEAENDNEDYSPANVVVHLNKHNISQELKKELRSKILSVRTYTDFVGMQGDQPNGLIQIEASKKFNLLTRRIGSKLIYIGVLTYLEPIFTISKIEKDRNAIPLSLSNIDSFQLKNGRKVLHLKAIDLLKYQQSTFDLNLNLYKYNLPHYKSNIQFNASAGLIRTNITDSVMVSGTSATKVEAPLEKTLTSFRWGGSILCELKPDSRYGFLLGWDFRKISLLNKDYVIPVIPRSVTNTFWADAYLKTNDQNKIFFRYRITFLDSRTSDNFVQIQLGYLLDIFKAKSNKQ